MAAAVVALPQPAQAVLPADVPDLEAQLGEGHDGHVLAHGGHGAGGDGGGAGQEERLDGGEERGLAGVVEAEEEDGVLCLGD